MNYESLGYNRNRWNRTLLNGYWLLLIMSILLESSYLTVTYLPSSEFVKTYIVYPSLVLIVVLSLTELAILALRTPSHDYVMIVSSSLFSIILVNVHVAIHYLMITLFLPVLISVFYFHRQKLLFALLVTLGSLHLIYWLNPAVHSRMTVVGLFVLTVIFTAFSLIAYGVLLRGRELADYSKLAHKSNQELLVQTILMDKLTKTDALTELYNHITFHEYMDKLVEQNEGYQLPLQLALIDIDNFKSVNDTFGHRAGDIVLSRVAHIIKSHVSMNDFAARYGGEEFAVLFTDKYPEQSLMLLETLRSEIHAEQHDVLGKQPVTVSIGLAIYRTGEGKESFFTRADNALYTAKRSGKNRIVQGEEPLMNTEEAVS
ncbi:GGDEF domain-containing protein [Paenibacillus sp. GCM10023252]|uniref:GGDEF domain-containing protein n=1 Tax=Paenibacillus sp. GCM10023252 TaxID=3252649 RepID=UPI00361360F1